jgi:hypothetical protein
MKPKKNAEQTVSPEMSYLINDLDQVVNKTERAFLKGLPYSIKVNGFRPIADVNFNETIQAPPTPRSITNGEDRLKKILPQLGEFKNIDLVLGFPLTAENLTDLRVVVNWSDGTKIIVQYSEIGTVEMVETGSGETINARLMKKGEDQQYINGLGLPVTMHGDDIAEFFKDLQQTDSIIFERTFKDMIDIQTGINIIESSSYAEDENGDKKAVQDLRIELDHYDPAEFELSPLYLPFRKTMLRFDKNANYDWHYQGKYDVPLISGEFPSEVVPDDFILGLPSASLLEKMFMYLKAKEEQL